MTIKITNKKDEKMDQTISHHATKDKIYLVYTIVHLVYHIKSRGVNDSTLLCSYYINGKWSEVTSKKLSSG